MTLNEYIFALQELILAVPEAGEMKVIYSIDDIGSAFNKVVNTPRVIEFEGFLKDYYREILDNKTEAVCVN